MKHILKNLTQQTDNKYLNIYLAEYEIDGGTKKYQICSRKPLNKLQVFSPNTVVPDGVRILPYYYENGKIKVCFIKEFRYAINNYIYSFPAGLVDEGEDPLVAAKRELHEEIGANVISIELTDKPCYCSAGLGDESIMSYEALVTLDGTQNLDFSEDISLHIVDFDDIPTFIEKYELGVQTRLQAKGFYYKTLYNKLKEGK